MTYGLSSEILARINQVFLKHSKIDQVILYGSRAKGTHHKGSDIDLILVGDKLELADLYAVDEGLDLLDLPYTIDLSLYGQITNKELIGHIEGIGEIFYKKEGFPFVRLDSLYNIARGGSPRPIKDFITENPDGINWIKISDATASGKYIYETKQKIIPKGIQRSRLVMEGDFILSNSMSFGRPYIMGTSGCIHDGWLVLSAKDERIDQDFLYYILGSPFVFKQFDSLASGSTVRNLNIDLVSGVRIPLLPLNKQKRIVAILDQAFAEIEKARANAEQNLKNARELFESYLQQVFSQRGDGWKREKLDDLGKITSSKRIYKREYVELGIPFYRTKEIKQLANNEEISTELFISEERFNEIKGKFGAPVKGDILMTAIGTIGEIYVVEDVTDFYFKDGNVLWLKNFSEINSGFLKYALLAFVAELNLLAKGAAYNALPIEKLKKYEIRVPSEQEQADLVKNFDYIRQKSSELHAVYINKLTALDELKKSILQKAFTGELTK